MTSAAPVHLAGTRIMLDPGGALVWPSQGILAVADLHLEKGTASAAAGHLLPPWDTRTTLEKLGIVLRRYAPKTILFLGDSFHDTTGATRLMPQDAARLAAIAQSHRLIWVLGNHDPAPHDLPGETLPEFALEKLVFRHIATKTPTPGVAEISGHYHPKASMPSRGGPITRPCFVSDGARRIILPAFGTYTGGLDVGAPAIGSLFPRGGRVFLLGQERLFSFALGAARYRGAA